MFKCNVLCGDMKHFNAVTIVHAPPAVLHTSAEARSGQLERFSRKVN